MNKFVVVVFPDEAKAYEGAREFQEIDRAGSATVFGTVVVKREANGALTVKQRSDSGPLGLGVGALTGGLIGLFGGPVGMAIGLAAGSVAGSWRDYIHADVSDEFLDTVQSDLSPGKFAVVAEVSEDWVVPIDVRMEALGGKVTREGREDFTDDLMERRVGALKAELAERKAERAGSKAQKMERKLETNVASTQAKLQRTAEKARERLDHTKQEMEAKVQKLEEQAAKATPEVKGRIQQRITELRTEYGGREQKLNRAYQLAQEALRA